MKATLPAFLRRHLDTLTASLTTSLGADLVAFLVYGAAVRGDLQPGQSDVETVLVLRDASLAKLDAIGPALSDARYAARISTTILTEDELGSVGAAVPFFVDAVADARVVLAGRDPFTETHVTAGQRRLRIEQRLRESLVRVRGLVAEACGEHEAVGGAVARTLRNVMPALDAFLSLEEPSARGRDLPGLLDAFERRYRLDLAALREPPNAPEAAYASFDALTSAILRELETLAREPTRQGEAPDKGG